MSRSDINAQSSNEQALQKNNESLNKDLIQGLMYHFGLLGFTQDLGKAKEYYAAVLAASPGYEAAKIVLLFAEASEKGIRTAYDWNILGVKYLNGRDNTSQDYTNARLCFEEALQKDNTHRYANYNLGLIYHEGSGVTQNSSKAKAYYVAALAASPGYEAAKKQLLFIKASEAGISTAYDWNILGVKYFNGRDNTPQDYINARICCEQALQKDNQHPYANYNLGDTYHNGLGVVQDLSKAKAYYTAALVANPEYEDAKKGLFLVHATGMGVSTACDWNDLGLKYHKGTRNIPQDYIKARLCYEQALQKYHAYVYANHNLGLIYYYGLGVTKDLVEARKYYAVSMNQGFVPARQRLRELEREHIESLAQSGHLDQQDSQGDTALHYVAREGFYKHYARLRELGANPMLQNMYYETPKQIIEGKNKEDLVDELQNIWSNTLQNYYKPTVEAIKSGILVRGQWSSQVDELFNTLQTLYDDPNIQPLFELAKLARFAEHKFSKRRRFDSGYDSDDDIGDQPSRLGQRLVIRFDSNRATVENLLGRGNGFCGMYSTNVIYLGGQRSQKELCGTLIHELTHFVAQEVFQNRHNPYKSGNEGDVNKKRFTEICETLRRCNDVSSTIKNAFSPYYSQQGEIHAELIVRVIQTAYEEGMDAVKQEPVLALWNYYIDTFLPAVKNHVSELKSKMLGGWNPKLFSNNQHGILDTQHSQKLEDGQLYSLRT